MRRSFLECINNGFVGEDFLQQRIRNVFLFVVFAGTGDPFDGVGEFDTLLFATLGYRLWWRHRTGRSSSWNRRLWFGETLKCTLIIRGRQSCCTISMALNGHLYLDMIIRKAHSCADRHMLVRRWTAQ